MNILTISAIADTQYDTPIAVSCVIINNPRTTLGLEVLDTFFGFSGIAGGKLQSGKSLLLAKDYLVGREKTHASNKAMKKAAAQFIGQYIHDAHLVVYKGGILEAGVLRTCFEEGSLVDPYYELILWDLHTMIVTSAGYSHTPWDYMHTVTGLYDLFLECAERYSIKENHMSYQNLVYAHCFNVLNHG